MEKRVIKFSLVGAILVTVLVIATIVSSVLIIKKINSKENGKNDYNITVQNDNNNSKKKNKN